MHHRLSLVSLGCLIFGASKMLAQGVPDYERPPVNYSASTPHDAVAELERRIAAGQLQLTGTAAPMLRTLLRELKVPVASQIVVFSKTSLQRSRITPKRPRVLYFSDSAYVGWVPGGVFEVTTIDPQLGPVFYSFDPQAARNGRAAFVRDSDCLRCHGGTFVRGIPAVFVRSVFPSGNGEPLYRHGSEVVDDQTPFEKRWGGWYVTGYTGSVNHRGNALASEQDDQLVFTPTTKRPTTLGEYFDPSDYLADTSDVVALLVCEHQLAVQNSLTRAAFDCRKMLVYQKALQTDLKETVTDEPTYDSVKSVFAHAVEDVIDRLLCRGEAPLPDGAVGHAAFRQVFAQDAPRSRAGHALKDLQLRDHIFAHRCSYLIYSDSFRSLPELLKARIIARLGDVLRGRDQGDRYAYIGPEEKQRIYDILRETHPDFKLRWTESKS
jgi:hypothetical protein